MKEDEPDRIVEKAVCGITYVKREGDRATNMLLHELEISVTATNPEDAERLFIFVKNESKDIENGSG